MTDFASYEDMDEESLEKSANPPDYLNALRTNAASLRARGVPIRYGWDLFRCRELWKSVAAVDPEVVLVHGLHYNVATSTGRHIQEDISNEDFKRLAASVLRAQFPKSMIVFVHTDWSLSTIQVDPPSLFAKVDETNGIDNWAMYTLFPPETLSALVMGEQLPRKVFEYFDGHHFDLLRYIVDVLQSGSYTLQLAANRFQLSRKIIDTLMLHRATNYDAVAAVRRPLVDDCDDVHLIFKKRKFVELSENLMYIFTYMELLEWGSTRQPPVQPLHLARYWDTGLPVPASSESGQFVLFNEMQK